ncbi:MAG: hypothetical protein KA995_06840, partial [Paludibacteraceae bacterium]|nr:hypothetical protein [Paludibacteraceae bacterium]
KHEEVLREVPRVREDFGYPPLVTPSSQIVGTQALFNVLMGERYKMVPQESKGIIKGEYGKTPAPISDEFRKKILGDEEAITCRPADLIAPELEKTREAIKDLMIQEEDVLTYALLPQVAEKFFQMRKNGTLEAVKEEQKKQATPVVASSKPAQETAESNDDEDEVAAVMSAAIATIESENGGGQFAITSVRQVSPWVISARLNR